MRPVTLFADEVAAEKHHAKDVSCESCGAPMKDAEAAGGLLLWFRGDEVRAETPPLCEDCTTLLSLSIHQRKVAEPEDGWF